MEEDKWADLRGILEQGMKEYKEKLEREARELSPPADEKPEQEIAA